MRTLNEIQNDINENMKDPEIMDFIEAFVDGAVQGIKIGLIASGAVFMIAARSGAVVPTKWRWVWAKWFWEKNPANK